MSIQIVELHNSREGTETISPEGQVSYLRFKLLADDGESDDDIRLFIKGYLPAYFRNRRFQSFRFTPLSEELWDVEALYGRQKPGATSYSFNTGEKTFRLTQALSQIAVDEEGTEVDTEVPDQVYFTPANPDFGTVINPATGEIDENEYLPKLNFKGAVGVKREGGVVKAEGVEVIIGASDFTLGIEFGPGETLETDSVDMMEDKKGKVNNDEIHVVISGVYRHWMPGELLFRGVAGDQKNLFVDPEEDAEQNWEGRVTLNFSTERNKRDATLFGVPHVNKDGWDYAEPIYEEEVADGQFLPVVRQVNVSRVYRRTTLAELFFGCVVDGPPETPPPDDGGGDAGKFNPDEADAEAEA